jgi:hypothetical protein
VGHVCVGRGVCLSGVVQPGGLDCWQLLQRLYTMRVVSSSTGGEGALCCCCPRDGEGFWVAFTTVISTSRGAVVSPLHQYPRHPVFFALVAVPFLKLAVEAQRLNTGAAAWRCVVVGWLLDAGPQSSSMFDRGSGSDVHAAAVVLLCWCDSVCIQARRVCVALLEDSGKK